MNSPDSFDDPIAQLVELSRKHGCSPDDLKRAYHRLAKQLHPDHGGNAEQFQRLQREYEVALTRVEHGEIVPTGAKRFVPWPVESRRPSREDVITAAGAALIGFGCVGALLPPEGRIVLATTLSAIAILVLLPLIMASARSHVVAVILFVAIPISFTFIVGAVQGKRFSEGDGDLQDIAIASLVLPAAATLLASIVGLLFWLAGDHN